MDIITNICEEGVVMGDKNYSDEENFEDLLVKGFNFMSLGSYRISIFSFTLALKILDDDLTSIYTKDKLDYNYFQIYKNLGLLFVTIGKNTNALKYYRKSFRYLKKIKNHNVDSKLYIVSMISLYFHYISLLANIGNNKRISILLTQMNDLLAKAIETEIQVNTNLTNDEIDKNYLASIYLNHGIVLFFLRDLDNAKNEIELAINILQCNFNDIDEITILFDLYHYYGLILIDLNLLIEAELIIEKMNEIYNRISQDGNDFYYKKKLASIYNCRGTILLKNGKEYKAVGIFKQANKIFLSLVQEYEENLNLKSQYMNFCYNFGNISKSLHNISQAQKCYLEYLKINKIFIDDNINNVDFIIELCDVYINLSKISLHKEKKLYFLSVFDLLKKLLVNNYENNNVRRKLSLAYYDFSIIKSNSSKYKVSNSYCFRTIKLLEYILKTNSKKISLKKLFTFVYTRIGNNYNELMKYKLALLYFEKAKTIWEEVFQLNNDIKNTKILANILYKIGKVKYKIKDSDYKNSLGKSKLLFMEYLENYPYDEDIKAIIRKITKILES